MTGQPIGADASTDHGTGNAAYVRRRDGRCGGPVGVGSRWSTRIRGVSKQVWPSGAATAIGSMPGTDPAGAAAVVFGELPDFPHLPELPARGVGADMLGRTAALLVDL